MKSLLLKMRRLICLILATTLLISTPFQASAIATPQQSTYTDLAKWTLCTIRNELGSVVIGSAAQSIYNYAYYKYYGAPKRITKKQKQINATKGIPDESNSLGCVGTAVAIGTDLYLTTQLNNQWNTQFEGLPALPISYYGLQYAANYFSDKLYKTSLGNWFSTTCTPSPGGTWSYVKSIASTAAVIGSLYAQYQAPLFINKYFLNRTLEVGRFLTYAGLSILKTTFLD